MVFRNLAVREAFSMASYYDLEVTKVTLTTEVQTCSLVTSEVVLQCHQTRGYKRKAIFLPYAAEIQRIVECASKLSLLGACGCQHKGVCKLRPDLADYQRSRDILSVH